MKRVSWASRLAYVFIGLLGGAACHSLPEHARQRRGPENAGVGGLGNGGDSDGAMAGTAGASDVAGAPSPFDTGGAAGGPDGADETDAEPPTVVSTNPAPEARGVRSGLVEIRFSEPMLPDTVVPEVTGGELSSSSWSDSGATLSLQLALTFSSFEEAPPGLERAGCEIRIKPFAADLAGNTLSTPFVLSFTPAVRVSHSLELYVPLRGHADGTFILAGDSDLNRVAMGLVPFDISAVSEEVLEVVEARLTLSLRSRSSAALLLGNPLHDLGDLLIEHAHFEQRSTAAYSTNAWLGDVGVLLAHGTLPTADTLLEVDVTDQVASDIAARIVRKNLSGFRIRFQTATDADDAPDQLRFWNLYSTHSSCAGGCEPYQIPRLRLVYWTE